MVSVQSHLIPTQPTQLHSPKPNTNSVQLQHTLDQLISEVNIPQIRSTNNNQDVKKRGTIRKLGQLVPNQAIQPSLVTLSGHRLLDPRNPSSAGGNQGLVLTISRKTPFSVYLKKALAHLRKPHPGPLILRAMGCAVSMAFSLALAVESHLHIAPPALLIRSLSTGTVVVGDELIPNSSDNIEPDLVYQTRNQASVEIKLSIKL